MIHIARLAFVISMIIALNGCATKERREVRGQCSVEAMRQHPPQIERQLVNKTRLVSVPTGSMTCQTNGIGLLATTSCTAGTTWESIPYVAMENVDLNAGARSSTETSCTNRVCFERYGNTGCKKE